ncbi:hypothetical protein [Dongia sp.]|uniref:hypothetical protein n=1 Tax=Dongia sp. TaxID=1977262 RepID=UPI00375052E5
MSSDCPLRPWETVVLYLALAVAALFPVFAVAFPPLADLPNHLARAHIMANLAADPALQPHYAIEWQLLSFQVSDLILPALVEWVGIEAAARIFILATFAALLGGVLALHKVLFGRVGVWPALAFLLIYNFMFGWGLLSYLFSTGLALLLLAGWIHTAPREGLPRSAGFAIATVLLFFFHFLALAVFALTVLAFELWRWRHDRHHLVRRMLLSGAVFVMPAALFLLAPRATIPMLNYYGDGADKVRAILAPFNLYFGWQDLLLEFLALLLAAIGIWKRLFPVAPALRGPLIAVGGAALLMPNQLMSVWGSDFRLPTVFLLLLIAATDLPSKKRAPAAIFVAAVVALLLVRVGTVTADWRRLDDDITELRAALTVIDRGSKVAVVQSIRDDRNPPAPSLYPYRHLGAFAVIDRDVFLPQLFSAATPLRFISPGDRWTTDQLAVIRDPKWHPSDPAFAADVRSQLQARVVTQAIQQFELATSTVDWTDWPERFDFLVAFDYGHPVNPVPALLTELKRGSFFSIYRIHAPAP